MAVLVRCPLPTCNKMTGWRYPDFQHARAHVDGVPPRVFMYERPGRRPPLGVLDELCPDPFGHVNDFRRTRSPSVPDLAPEVSFAPPDEDPVDDPNEDLVEKPETWVEGEVFLRAWAAAHDD